MVWALPGMAQADAIAAIAAHPDMRIIMVSPRNRRDHVPSSFL
jgi:hypothetical protein